MKKKAKKWICKRCLKSWNRQDHFAGHLRKEHGTNGVMFLGDACYGIESIKPIKKRKSAAFNNA